MESIERRAELIEEIERVTGYIWNPEKQTSVSFIDDHLDEFRLMVERGIEAKENSSRGVL